MNRLIVIAAYAVLVAGCSASISTDLVPTTAPADSVRVVVGDQVGLPSDSADAAVVRLLLDIREEGQDFLGFYDYPDIATIGAYVDYAEENMPFINANLDRTEAMNTELKAFLGSDDISASQSDLRSLTGALDVWIAGQRLQNDPDEMCFDKIPKSTMSQPIDRLGEQSAYMLCFTRLMASDTVAETTQAGERYSKLFDIVYSQIVEG